MSQLVQEEGAKPRRLAEPGTQRDPRHARLTHAPSPGPKGKKRRSHAVPFPFLPEQSQALERRLKKTNYSRKLRQRARQAGGGDCPPPGACPLPWRLGVAQHILPTPSWSLPGGAPSAPYTLPKPASPGSQSCLPVSSRKLSDSAFSAPTSCH